MASLLYSCVVSLKKNARKRLHEAAQARKKERKTLYYYYLHKLHNEVYQLLFLHLLTMVISDEEADVITLGSDQIGSRKGK